MFTLGFLLGFVLWGGLVVAAAALLWDRYTRLRRQLDEVTQERDQVRRDTEAQLARYRPITNLEQEAQRLNAEIQRFHQEHVVYVNSVNAQRQTLAADIQRLQAAHAAIQREIQIVEDKLDDISYGIYQPHYAFDAPEAFRQELDRVREAKKELIRANRASVCLIEWTVQGSRKEGERMQKQLAKLMIRAFNGECDAGLANVTWNNMTKMEERLRRAYDAINKQGTVVQVSLTPEYLNLAIAELRLTFEYEEKKHAAAEEQRRIKERMREEERAQRELLRAEQDAVEDEARYSKLLAKALAEAADASGTERTELSQRIQKLEAELAAAQARHQRAISMAQLTRCGYVYIISNIGSFGEDMIKMGMTRRLDPMDRVWELSDASVPFDFDVHGMIYSEDAPALENALHTYFAAYRVNLVNPRKEFFRVTLDLIEDFLRSRGLTIELTKLVEAREFRESVGLRQQGKVVSAVPASSSAAAVLE